MKAVILEIRDGLAAALREDGVVVRTRANGASVGDTIELRSETVVLPSRRTRFWRTAVAAMLVLALTGGSLSFMGNTASAYVSLDTEDTSIEMSVNAFGQVIGVRALDEGSSKMAETLSRELRRKPMEDALHAAVMRLCPEDPGGSGVRTVVAGITAGSDGRRAELAQKVERTFGRDGRGDIRFRTMPLTPQERRDADAHDMSPGRYAMEQRGEPFPPPPPPGGFDPGDRDDWDDRFNEDDARGPFDDDEERDDDRDAPDDAHEDPGDDTEDEEDGRGAPNDGTDDEDDGPDDGDDPDDD